MPTQVTLNIFSGRPNPTWAISTSQEKELLDQLQAIKTPTLAKPTGVLGRLGYRGFAVTRPVESPQGPLGLLVHEGIIDHGQGQVNLVTGNHDLEKWLLGTAPDTVGADLKTVVTTELSQPALKAEDFINASLAPISCPACYATDAPVYNPSYWNTPSVRPYNNCYNYANDNVTNSFAQPGRASGAQHIAELCANMKPAALADGLVVSPNFTSPQGPGQGWYVALVIWPNTDYHWYRQDGNGCWSHKPGGTAAHNTDNSGNPISDPAMCDSGPYTDFCTYMITKRGLVIS